jgi:TonB family protein
MTSSAKTRLWLVAAAAAAIIYWQFPRNVPPQAINGPIILPLNDRLCQTPNQRRLEYHYETSDDTDITQFFATQCSTLITLPKKYAHWFIGSGDNPDKSHWFFIKDRGADKYSGPYDAAGNGTMNTHSLEWYIQSAEPKGFKLHFYTDVATKETNRSESAHTPSQADPEPPLPILTKLSLDEGEGHLCNKPDDALYDDRAFQGPTFLFDIHNNFDLRSNKIVNWAEGFHGKVIVCFIVDEKGNPTDVHLLQSIARPSVEKQIIDAVQGWRFKPQLLDNRAVKTQLAETFEFY